MKNRSLVTHYLNRSKSRVKAVETLMAEKSCADVVRESQEVIELLCKALVRHLGAEPARVLDVGTQLTEFKEGVSGKFHNGVKRLISYSKTLRRDREPAFYGSEDLTPSEICTAKEASEAISFARENLKIVYDLVGKK